MTRLLFLVFSLLTSVLLYAQTPLTISGTVSDSEGSLAFATVVLKNNEHQHANITNETGEFTFNNVQPGNYTFTVTFVGYNTLEQEVKIHKNTSFNFNLTLDKTTLDEVVITAKESRDRITSSSKIDKQAMVHLQPSSFSDLLELLPGGISKDPVVNQSNFIKLREANIEGSNNTEDKYLMSSLGTSFVIDDTPINTSGNLQKIDGYTESAANTSYYRNTVNKGVDMRTLSTDQIESVEIVRGIASAEYGDLTSGLVNIKRKEGKSKLEARFKADATSKLVAVNKGIGNKNQSLNLSIDYLDAKHDPRNNLENYKRLTASTRFNKLFDNSNRKLKWNINLDYTTSIDAVKEDADVNYRDIDKYKSTFNKVGLSNRLEWTFKQKFIKTFLLHGALNAQFDKLEQTKYVSLAQDVLLPNSTNEGEQDGFYLPLAYTANLEVDGKPLNAFLKAMSTFSIKTGNVNNRLKVGANWQWTKNYGKGQVYDPTRPLSPLLYTRPRPYNDVPAGSELSLFIEDETRIPIGLHQIKLVAGLRSINMLNISNKYDLNGKTFIDPRINAQWALPAININNDKLKTSISVGIGWHTKLPTLSQLYPNDKHIDIVQLNYFHTNPDYKRINFISYINDRANYNLGAARNRKSEIRIEAEYKNNRISVTYFKEDMNSAFQALTRYKSYDYKKYDYSGINHNNITAPPALEDMPYDNKKAFEPSSSTYNSASLLKEGVEFQFSSARIAALKTRITIDGAWFKNIYNDNLPTHHQPSTVINNEKYPYIGIYEYQNGSKRQQFNTNFTFDTYFKELGFEFSTTVQCMWFTRNEKLPEARTPDKYMDLNGIIHDYTEADQSDAILQHLVRNLTITDYKVPLALYVNFKATKVFADRFRLSLFVNRMLDYLPNYEQVKGKTIRRSTTPYFGMEINFTI